MQRTAPSRLQQWLMPDIPKERLRACTVQNNVARVCRMNIGGDGIYYFKTELAGDESKNGWGGDPEPHIHYDLICRQDLCVPSKFEYLHPIQTCQFTAYLFHTVNCYKLSPVAESTNIRSSLDTCISSNSCKVVACVPWPCEERTGGKMEHLCPFCSICRSSACPRSSMRLF